MPSSLQAADYSAATQFLRAVAASGDVTADSVIAWLRHSTLNDMYVRNGRVRPDGTMLHDMYLLQVKAPKSAQDSWDVYELIDTVSGEEAFPERDW